MDSFAPVISTYRKLSAIPLVFLGIGVQRAWSSLLLSQSHYPLVNQHSYIAGLCILVIMSFIFAATAKHKPALHLRRKLLVFTVTICMAGTLLAVYPFVFPDPEIAAFIGSALAISTVSVTMLLWCEFFSMLNPTRVALVYSSAIIFGQLLSFFMESMDTAFLSPLVVLMPLVNMVWAVDSIYQVERDEQSRRPMSKGRISFPYQPVVLMAAVAFTDGFTQITHEPNAIAYLIGVSLIPCLIIAAVLSKSKKFQLETVYSFAMPAIAIAMIMLLPTNSIASGYAPALFSAGDTTLAIMTMIIFSGISYRYGVDPVWLNGIERGVRFSLYIIGWILQTALSPLLSSEASLISKAIIAIATVIVFSVFFVPNRRLFASWGVKAKEGIDGEAQSIDERTSRIMACESLCRDYGLTAREQEIFMLMSEGKSSLQIENALVIAQGTLKAHISHIYTKLDIHSRKDLDSAIQTEATRIQRNEG